MSLTVKQEGFCTAFVETGNASEAYRRSYNAEKMKPASVNRKAKELLDNGKITARVEELRAAALERHEFTVDDMIVQLDEDRKFARECGSAAAAVSASMGKAKVLGLLVDKVDHRSGDGSMSPKGRNLDDFYSEP